MPAIFRKEQGDTCTFWMMTYAIGGDVIHLQLISGDTAFGTKHMLNTNQESATSRKARRDCTVGDARDQAIAMSEFLNFSGNAMATNTVIEYDSEAELQNIMAAVAEAFGGVGAWPVAPALQEETIVLPSSCVVYTGAVNKVENRVKLGAFLKGANGVNKTIVIKHLSAL